MANCWINPEFIGAFVGLVWPGLLALHVYRLLIATDALDWAEALIRGFFFTMVNYIVLFPFVLFVLKPANLENHPLSYWGALATLWLVGPVVLPLAWKRLLGSKLLARHLQQPYPTAWDFYFDRREPAFLLIHLKNGNLLGGFFGPGSYASAFPEHGDLYLTAVYSLKPGGRFGTPIPLTKGLLIRRDEYSYIELFDVPRVKEVTNG
ncbi:MAG: DUF6338 family protein [Chloroflexi bacterium]|nr:DUF6338 family protein [Chloroflexota bacterium]